MDFKFKFAEFVQLNNKFNNISRSFMSAFFVLENNFSFYDEKIGIY